MMKNFKESIAIASLLACTFGLLNGCAASNETGIAVLPEYSPIEILEQDVGVASYYHEKLHGRTTANGERYNKHLLTAAHREYPFGSLVRVTHLKNRRSVIVRINDRGPWRKKRVIDLSLEAAKALDMLREGIVEVKVEVVSWGGSAYN